MIRLAGCVGHAYRLEGRTWFSRKQIKAKSLIYTCSSIPDCEREAK